MKKLFSLLSIVSQIALASGGGSFGGGGGSGVTSINSDATAAQTLAVGTTGTDFALVNNGTGTHTFNLPSASATARGVMSTGAQTIAGAKTFSTAPILSSLTASQAVFTDGSKNLTSNAITGTGNVVMSASPTLTGTITGAAETLSGNLTLSNTTASQALFTDGSKVVVSNALTGTGNVVMSASPTLTGTITAAAATLSGNLLLSNTTASQALFTDGSKNVVSNAITGTGNVVMSASPTFTGTAVLASATVSGSLKSGNYHLEPSEVNIGNSSTSFTADWSSGSAQLVTMTGNVTSITFSNPVTGGAYVLRVATGAGGFTATGWPGTVKWSGGTAPTITATASKVDLINFYYDGTSYYGSFTQNY